MKCKCEFQENWHVVLCPISSKGKVRMEDLILNLQESGKSVGLFYNHNGRAQKQQMEGCFNKNGTDLDVLEIDAHKLH